jgi:membrane fusion protein (multidrug efflux system)
LLPPENATGNFIKVVQRLPVRIDLVDYDADQTPLFIGTSVVPYVDFKKPPIGPDAGKFLQAYVPQTLMSPSPNPGPAATTSGTDTAGTDTSGTSTSGTSTSGTSTSGTGQ